MSDDLYLIPKKATVDAAHAILAEAAIDRGSQLTLDASEVESIDGCVVLTVAALADSVADGEQRLAVKEPSAAFVDAFSDLGLFQDLMKMEFVK